MSIRNVSFAPGEWYHCYNRGADKCIIFKSLADYQRFVMLLYISNNTKRFVLSDFGKHSGGPTLKQVVEKIDRKELLVDIGAYALMPNHYHLLIKERLEGGVSAFMQKLGTAYTMAFNLKYRRTGVLFSGKFKARHVNEDRYMRRVVNYIHANPVEIFEPGFKKGNIRNKKKLEKELLDYPFSSFPDYQHGVTERLERKIINQSEMLDATDVDLDFQHLVRDAFDFVKEQEETKS